MSMTSRTPSPASDERPRYLEERAPIIFPEAAEVPETQLHLNLRTLLYLLLQDALGDACTVCSDQFVYFDAEDPSRCLAPDAFVRRGAQAELVRTWKVWERGAPEVGVEIVSEFDSGDLSWERKLSRYRQLGVSELLRFDPSDAERPLRIWDRVEGTLVEREISAPVAASLVLPLGWVVAPAEGLPRALRIEQDGVLVPTAREARAFERRALDEQRVATDVERQAKDAAEARVKQLEAELRRRGD